MKTQGSNGDLIQKFFRVYIPNFTEDNMNLPFVSDNTSGMHLPQKVTVKSVSSGNIWRMEMTTNGESDAVFLRDGWKKIVKDENITEPVFLVFEFDGSRLFHFCVYEHSSMCKRTRSPMEKEVIDVESEEETEDDDESTKEFDESPRRKERGGTSRQRLKTDSHKVDEYLDDELNPSFPVDMTQSRSTRIPSLLIKDYNLTFPNLVTVRDKNGKLKRKILVWKNKSVYLSGLRSFIRRNHVKKGDKMFCELKMVDGYQGLVHEIKVHIIEG
ncbi:PREDICTED: B3 domain-containing protein REM22-like [Camelina sativa]|uniref:B3 domain-containing protein REM22-like n=1 Tax=Camelina sativa TaxID=90675 RepID=A0ABM1Q6L4_CAMSA|nr:PREDICTED: B3 domain-containing protein REM22-like [Camelina sativa]